MRRSATALLAAGLVAAGTFAVSPLIATANVEDVSETADAAEPVAAAPVSGTAAPDPVVIVGGTTAPGAYYGPMAARLGANGYRPFIYALPGGGLQDINTTTAEFASFVAGVQAETGAAKVDLVAHSQGGLVAMDFVKRHGGDAAVDSVVTLGTPHYGTVVANHANGAECYGAVACEQMAVGSKYLVDLAKVAIPTGVRVTALSTSQDELVMPVGNASVRKGAVNVLVQEQCPSNTVSHVALPLSGVVYSGVRTALAGGPVQLDCGAF